jgi:phosphotransacetylase
LPRARKSRSSAPRRPSSIKGWARRFWSGARTGSRDCAGAGLDISGITIDQQCALSQRNSAYAHYLYEKLQRQGYLFRDCQRMINQDRNHFAAAMVALGDADAMVTGVTRNYSIALEEVRRVIDPKPGHRLIGVIACAGARPHGAGRRHGDHRDAHGQEIAEIAIEAAGVSRRLGYEPRVALLGFATFGHPAASARRVCRRRSRSSTSGASISNMTAKWPPTWRSTAS